MKMSEKILNYFAGKFSEKDKSEFEAELKTNTNLKNLFDQYSRKLNEIKEIKDINVNEAYFNNLLPRTWERINKRKKKVLIPKLVYALPAVIVIIYFIFYSGSPDMFSKFVADLPDSSKQAIANYLDKENTNLQAELMRNKDATDLLENEISNSVDIQSLNIESRFTYNDDYELLKKLTPEEADKIFNSLVDKKIL